MPSRQPGGLSGEDDIARTEPKEQCPAEAEGEGAACEGTAAGARPKPVFGSGRVRYEIGARISAMSCGGIGAVRRLVSKLGLAGEINRRLKLLKVHLPYHESDHVLNVAYNMLCGGTRLEDLGALRNNVAYMDALGAALIPSPSAAGDFTRRFAEADVIELMEGINAVSHRGAAEWIDRAIGLVAPLCRAGVRARGHGLLADRQLRPPAAVHGPDGQDAEPAGRREGADRAERGYLNKRLNFEDVAEFEYSPLKCRETYRMVVVRKNISKMKGDLTLMDEIRYFFYITTRRDLSADQLVRLANARCDQENVIEQLKNGVNALRVPMYDLVSNWAYMVMAALAWNLKSWFAMMMHLKSDRRKYVAMEFKRFIREMILLPCQVIRRARQTTLRIIGWQPTTDRLFSTWRTIERTGFG